MPACADPVITVAQMRAAEHAAIAAGATVAGLMARAGEGAARWVWRIAAGGPVTVLAGPGNNGGDGYVLAEALRRRGGQVRVIAPLAPATDACRDAAARWRGPVETEADGLSGDVWVDALFGVGLARPLSAKLATLLAMLARSHARGIAIDLPSGIAADTGAALNDGLPHYAITLALGAYKHAHYLMPAMACCGAVRVVGLGLVPPNGAATVIAPPVLGPPAAAAHKYTRGLLAVIGGAMAGAGLLAARTAMRSGPGYVKLFAPHSHPDAPADLVVDHTPLAQALADGRIDAALIGPGLGRDDDARDRLASTLDRNLPLVLDADALVLLRPGDCGHRAAPLVATPHEGELAGLLDRFGCAGDGPKPDRAARLATAMDSVVVAKGPDTVIAAPDGRIAFAPPSPAWLASAGTGDALAGIVAGRLAAGDTPFAAACAGVWLHGEAAREAGPMLTAEDLAPALRIVIARRA